MVRVGRPGSVKGQPPPSAAAPLLAESLLPVSGRGWLHGGKEPGGGREAARARAAAEVARKPAEPRWRDDVGRGLRPPQCPTHRQLAIVKAGINALNDDARGPRVAWIVRRGGSPRR